MADSDNENDLALTPPVAPMLERAAVSWLGPVRSRLDGMLAEGRLSHGLLISGPPGAGQSDVATWLAAATAEEGPTASD